MDKSRIPSSTNFSEVSSVDILFIRLNKIDATTLLTFQESSIDVMLPSLLLKFGTNCYVVNGKYPERVLSLIDDNVNDYNFDYTQIIGDKK